MPTTDKKKFSSAIKKRIHKMQEGEITESSVYMRLASKIKDKKNAEVLRQIATEEMQHYAFWKNLSGEDIVASKFRVTKYYLMARIFGLTFALKLMERGETVGQKNYQHLKNINGVSSIIAAEKRHEKKLTEMINEKRLEYISSIVLGLNDALVELTGALAGFTFVFADSHTIAIAGTVTGIAAALSMASSEYLSMGTDEVDQENGKNPITGSIATGIAYIITVALLVTPFYLISTPLYALCTTLAIGVVIILSFTYYTAIAKDFSFKKRSIEMVSISMGVAAISFAVGYLLNTYLGA